MTAGWKAFGAGAACMLGAILLIGGGILLSGRYDVAATTEHTGAVRWLLDTGLRRSVTVHAANVPTRPALDAEAIEHGFVHFDAMCVQCHGAPGVPRGEVGAGMNPTPPGLDDATEEWTPAELYWITRNGIKLAGMPAFGPTHTDEELWAIVDFLEELPSIDSAGYQERVTRLRSGSAGGEGEGVVPATHTHAPGTPPHSH